MSIHKKGNPIETKIRFRKKLRVSVVGPDVKARCNVARCNVARCNVTISGTVQKKYMSL